MALVSDITNCGHRVGPDLALNGEFVVLRIGQLVAVVERPVIRERLDLSPGKGRVRIGGRYIRRGEGQRKALSYVRATEPGDVRRLKQWRSRTPVIQAIRWVAHFEELREVFNRGVVKAHTNSNAGTPRSSK